MSWLPKNKVVVPIDFSKQSLAAVDVALGLVEDASHVDVVHVLPVITDYEVSLALTNFADDERQRHADKILKERLPSSKYPGLNRVVLIGDAGTEIAQYAEAHGADVIVLPSHGYTGLKRLLIGSVAERIVRLAHCPVLVLKHINVECTK